METAEPDEKFATIRQTVRRVILPLVQSIYEVDPPDIELFCSQFFESQLRKREEDRYFKSTEDFPDNHEEGRYIQKTEDGVDKTTSSTTNIQGSASDPVLTSEKCHGVRETSSWDITPNHSKPDGRRKDVISDLSDAKCGVGDQLCQEITTSVGDPEINRKAGDEHSLPKREDKSLRNENNVSSNETARFPDDLPSAPPYDDHNSKLENTKIGFENSENSDQEIEIILEKNISALKGKETNLVPHFIHDGASCSYSDGHTDVGGLKRSTKLLSPNSSFGFIPHLNETCVKQESPDFVARSKSSKGPDFEKGTIADTSDLASQYSETLQDLAQKFNSAETNLDVEFQKAKEISDLMHGRSLMVDLQEESNLSFSTEKDVDSYIDVEESGNINSVSNINESNHQIQIEEKSSFYSHVEEKEEFETDQNAKKSASRKIPPGANEEDIRKEEPELYKVKKDSSIQQKKFNDDKNQTNIVNSSGSVDEEWRKRWYDAHPCLDNSSNRLRQTSPRIPMGPHLYYSVPGNPIGEAGDVPSDLYRHTPQSNLRHFEANSREERNTSFSPILEEQNSQEKHPSDEMQRRDSTKLTFNNLDKDTARSKASSNVPYTWRNMSKQQARYLETEKQVLKQLQESCGEGAIRKEIKSIGNSKASGTKALHNNLSEAVVEKQTNKNNYDNEVNNKSETTRNTEQEDCEGKKNKHKFKDNTFKKLQSSPFVKNELFKAEDINKHASKIDDKSVKNFSGMIEENSDSFKTKPKSFNNGSEKTISKTQNDPEEDKHKDFDTYFRSEKDRMHRNDGDAAKNFDRTKNMTSRFASNDDVISEVKDEIRAYQRMDNSSKIEPGLDSAGGDFTSSNVVGNEEQLNSPDYAEHNTSPGNQEVTVEYVEGIIERVTQQDSLTDSYEGLNFSSYSDIDSSDMESEYSDAEDSNLYTKVCEP